MKKQKNTRLKFQGFTLAELLIALAILGVVATFTIPKVLTAQQNQQKYAIFKEAIAACQNALTALVYDGQVSYRSHTCGTNTPIDPILFDDRLNYIKVEDDGVGHRVYTLANESTISLHVGWHFDFMVDWNGPNEGTNTFGDDVVIFFLNDTDSVCGTMDPNHFGVSNFDPVGFVAENNALWEGIFEN